MRRQVLSVGFAALLAGCVTVSEKSKVVRSVTLSKAQVEAVHAGLRQP